jgi:hypothetical protein
MVTMIPKHAKLKKPEISQAEREAAHENGIQEDVLFKGLEIAERTQKPPSEELISRLNELVSKPPFSYTHKVKENDTL